MNKKRFITIATAFFVAMAFFIPAFAGGWATITLDSWPTQVVAIQPLEIGFTVRQHGQDGRLMSDLSPEVSAKNTGSGESLSVIAQPEGKPGHYVARLTFPSPGVWSWSIAAFTMEQPMPELIVGGPAAIKSDAATGYNPGLIAGFLGLAFALVSLVVVFRRQARWALALVVVGLVVSGVGFASASAAEQPDSTPPQAAPSLSQEELGRNLFIAKGCATCHVNRRVERNFTPVVTEIGPDLTSYTASAEYLTIWLKDPSAAKPNTEMPNLGLNQVEIEALIAFLNASQAK
jgi:cytochrome c2